MANLAVEHDEGFATVILDRPAAMNALSRALRQELIRAMAELAKDDRVRAVILTGRGDRAFTAGVDLKELAGGQSAPFEIREDDDPALAVSSCPKPVIAAVNGVAITGGLELMLACDILIASTTARFADTHVRVGILPGWGLSQRLPLLIGPSRAKEMSLTGNFIDAQTALQWGLVNRVTAPEDLLAEARRIAADIASCAPRAVQHYKRTIDIGLALEERLAMERGRSVEWLTETPLQNIDETRRAVQSRGRQQN